MAKKLPPYLPLIDNKKTGAHLRQLVESRGITVKEIQNYLGLSCPQSIYRWLDGKYLPNIDNLYALQGLLDMPIDKLIQGSYRPQAKLPARSSKSGFSPSDLVAGNGTSSSASPLQTKKAAAAPSFLIYADSDSRWIIRRGSAYRSISSAYAAAGHLIFRSLC